MGLSQTALIERFAGQRVLVLGDAMLDSYLSGSCSRLCQEAPVPIVQVGQRADLPGGAANSAANVGALGAEAWLLAVSGDDAEGDRLGEALRARGLTTTHLLRAAGRRTLSKQRVLADGQLLVRFDQGEGGPPDEATERWLLERLAALFPLADAVIVSDYGYGVLTPRVLAALADLQRRTPRLLCVDAKRLEGYRQVSPTAVKPNFGQAARLLELPALVERPARVELVVSLGERLLERSGAQIAAVTLDVDGALVFERGRPTYRTYARPTSHSRAAGAGDTYLAALALALAAGADTPAAAELAAAAAALAVEQDGTSVVAAAELRAHVAAENQKVASEPALLAERLALHRRAGRRVVFTNGCFDLLHRGHVTYLSRAKALGEVLVVGVNSDASVRRLKGPERPINPLEDRLQVLAALSCVDHLIAFDEDTPIELLRVLWPDVFVKGGDYTRESLPEAPVVEALGGTVELLPYLEDRSTTGLVERIQAVGRTARPRAVRRNVEREPVERLDERAEPAVRQA